MKLNFLHHKQRKTGGRNNLGRLTAFRKGGGHKQTYKYLVQGHHLYALGTSYIIIKSIFNTNAKVSLNLINYKEDLFFNPSILTYIPCIEGQLKGHFSDEIGLGQIAPLIEFKSGDLVSFLNLGDSLPFTYAKAPGSYGLIQSTNFFGSVIKLPSKQLKFFPSSSIGFLGKTKFMVRLKKSKAGVSRHKGIRPVTRGTAMNPVDHPHGGGEGKTRGKLPRSFTGKLTKGIKTRKRIQILSF